MKGIPGGKPPEPKDASEIADGVIAYELGVLERGRL